MTKKEVTRREESEVVQLAPESILHVIQSAATNPDVDIDKMERLMQMHERLMDKQAHSAYIQAMAVTQSEIKKVIVDKRNEQTHSDYASYEALDREVRPIYTRHGFSLSFDTEPADKDLMVRVVCEVSHTAGHTRKFSIDMPADGKGAKGGDVMTKTHATGSGLSYGMRYLLKMIFNIAVGVYDDDGNAAGEATITEEQAADLEALMSEVGADRKAFLKTCRVDDLELLPQSKLKGAIQRLEQKRKAG